MSTEARYHRSAPRRCTLTVFEASAASATENDMNIEDPDQLLQYLRQNDRINLSERPHFTPLTGGVSNRTVWVQFDHGRDWVMKQALAKLRVQVDWSARRSAFSARQRAWVAWGVSSQTTFLNFSSSTSDIISWRCPQSRIPTTTGKRACSKVRPPSNWRENLGNCWPRSTTPRYPIQKSQANSPNGILRRIAAGTLLRLYGDASSTGAIISRRPDQ